MPRVTRSIKLHYRYHTTPSSDSSNILRYINEIIITDFLVYLRTVRFFSIRNIPRTYLRRWLIIHQFIFVCIVIRVKIIPGLYPGDDVMARVGIVDWGDNKINKTQGQLEVRRLTFLATIFCKTVSQLYSYNIIQ